MRRSFYILPNKIALSRGQGKIQVYEASPSVDRVPVEGKTWIQYIYGEFELIDNSRLEEIKPQEPEDELETLTRLIKFHDVTHMYSDDGEVYRRGHESLMKINALIKKYPVEGTKLWNDMIDRCISEGYREEFYKKGS